MRSERSLIQTIGRAARHINGTAILYADLVTASIKGARRDRAPAAEQRGYNETHGITPKGVIKRIKDSSTACTTRRRPTSSRKRVTNR